MTATLPPRAGESEPPPSTADLPARARRALRRAAPWLVAALAGGLVALVSAYLVWPHGTVNLDEVVYLNQAEALRHGSLTFDADTYLPDFRPYLSGVDGDRVVFKYQPLWPAVLAASQAATGDHRAALVVTGAATALALWLLGREVTGSRWWGTATAVALVVSPVFVTHSGSVLAYLPSAGLAAAGLAAALRLGRTWSWRWAVGAGAGYGLLFFHRPYDAVLGALPVGVWLAWRARRQRRWASLAVVAGTGLPFVAAWLAYNRIVTGDALTPAFSVGAADDRFGFGLRASWTVPGHESRGMIDFTPLSSAGTVGHFAARSPLWLAGGVVTLGLAGWAVARGRHDRRRLVLAATVATVIAGHWLWWGTENFVQFGLDGSLGPAYWLGALGPVLVLATAGARDLLARARSVAPPRRALLGGVAAVAVVSSLAAGAMVGGEIGRAGDARDWQVGVLDAAPVPSVLLVPNPPDDPFARGVVPVDLAGASRLVAVGDGTATQLFRLRDRFGDRPLWAWRPVRPADSAFEPTARFHLGELPEMAAQQVAVELVAEGAAPAGDGWLRLVDDDEIEIDRIDLPLAGGTAGGAAVPVTSATTGGTVASATTGGTVASAATGGTTAGPSAPAGALVVGDEPCWLAAGVTVTRPDGRTEMVEVKWAVRAREGRVEVIGPGVGRRHYAFPGGASGWFDEDVSGALSATLEGLAPFAPQREESQLAW